MNGPARIIMAATLALIVVPASADAYYRPPGAKYCGLASGTHNTYTDRVYVRNTSCAAGLRLIRGIKSAKGDGAYRCSLHLFPGGSEGSRCVAGKGRRVYGIPTVQGGGI